LAWEKIHHLLPSFFSSTEISSYFCGYVPVTWWAMTMMHPEPSSFSPMLDLAVAAFFLYSPQESPLNIRA
jgi:hypothetical protein